MKWIEFNGKDYPEAGEYVVKTLTPLLKFIKVMGYVKLTKNYSKEKKKWIYSWHVNNQLVTHYLDESQ